MRWDDKNNTGFRSLILPALVERLKEQNAQPQGEDAGRDIPVHHSTSSIRFNPSNYRDDETLYPQKKIWSCRARLALLHSLRENKLSLTVHAGHGGTNVSERNPYFQQLRDWIRNDCEQVGIDFESDDQAIPSQMRYLKQKYKGNFDECCEKEGLSEYHRCPELSDTPATTLKRKLRDTRKDRLEMMQSVQSKLEGITSENAMDVVADISKYLNQATPKVAMGS